MNKKEKIEGIINKFEEEEIKIKKIFEDNLKNKEEEFENTKIEINKTGLHLKRLKEEQSEITNNIGLFKEYQKSINKTEIDIENLNVKVEKIEKDIEKNKNENKKVENIEISELENKYIVELNQEKKKIEIKIKKADIQLSIESVKMQEFEYKYEEGTRNPINGKDFKAINDEINKIIDEKKILDDAKMLCENGIRDIKIKREKRYSFNNKSNNLRKL